MTSRRHTIDISWLIGAVIFAAVIIGLFFYGSEAADCDKRGGVLVQAQFGYACVAAPGHHHE